ncbi:MAG: hypothetical protein LJE70_12030 [Chromatiaceae bacterium]|nr:hypothetical protein [Chromatiaceae bacterium]
MNQQPNPSPLPVERSQAALALDNLVRRHLRVSDPADPDAISQALRERYGDERQALEQEAAGLPFFKVTRVDAHFPVDGSTSAELRQARTDRDQDLTALTTSALLKDIHPELRGWAHTLRNVVEVVFWATRGSGEDLRALGATALLSLERFRRLDLVLRRRVDPESPALATYLSAIRLFLDTVENAGTGYRLLYIARPPIAF